MITVKSNYYNVNQTHRRKKLSDAKSNRQKQVSIFKKGIEFLERKKIAIKIHYAIDQLNILDMTKKRTNEIGDL
jgi:hypothetical protein